MTGSTRIERRLERALAHTTSVRGAVIVIAVTSTVITVAAGIAMTFVDSHNFPSIGSGLWWAVQTVTTVGYGDHVPTTYGGRIVAAAVMLAGIGFLTVITAAITSAFMARSGLERAAAPVGATTESGEAVADELRQIRQRLEQIEAALAER